MTTTKMATPTKLRTGNWGATVQGQARIGDMITITTASGKSWQARISKVVWAGNGVSICATESMDRPAGRQAMGPGRGSAPNVPGYSSYCTDNGNCRCFDCAS